MSVPPSETLELPTFLESGLPLNPNVESAYNLVFATERAARDDKKKLHARIVGRLMIALGDLAAHLSHALPYLVSEITSNLQDDPSAPYSEVIDALGIFYRDNLLRAFRSNKGPLPPRSHHPSRPSFDSLDDMISYCMVATGNDYKQLKSKTLVRDGFRCSISLQFDRTSAKDFKQLRPPGCPYGTAFTECCHIIAQSTAQYAEENENKRRYASQVLTILESFGLGALLKKLTTQAGLHRPENTFTVREELHSLFDLFGFALEPTATVNEYKLHVYEPEVWQGLGTVPAETVTFHSCTYNGETVAAPDPQLFAIHYACASVAHMSGAADLFDKWDRDAEAAQPRLLAADGSSGDLLLERLAWHAVSAY